MEPRPFLDRATPPTDETLARALGAAHASFTALTKITAGLDRGWSHGGASGWMQKIHDRRKALCYVIPLDGAFRVSLTVRPRERAPLLADPALAAIHAALSGAAKQAEGYALRFDIADRASFAPVGALLARLIVLRG